MRETRKGYTIKIDNPSDTGLANDDSSSESHTFSVEPNAANSDKKEVLMIDGKLIPFHSSDKGYRIYYQPPEPDLLKAARSYVDTQREK